MSSDETLDVRPRTTGEVLDDAWRLYFADAPQLLVLHGLFAVPAFGVLLLALTLPARGAEGLVWALLAACAVPLTGIGSGACQEWFRRRSQGKSVRLRDCLGAALRLGLYHAAARATVLACVLLGSACLIMPGLTLWVASATVHTLLAGGKGHPLADLRELGREAKFDPVKSAAVILSRLPLLLLAFLNLYLAVAVGLWVGDSLCGFDLALPGVVLSLANPAFDTALFLGCWLLLAPYFEASNFLLYLDTRTRQEGLDLLFRVQRAFPLPGRKTAGTLAAIVLALFAATARAAEPTLEAVRAVRQGVEAVTKEVQEADPYPGGGHWERRLQELARRLEQAGDGDARRYPWFASALKGFHERSQADAVEVLRGLQRRLALLEETLSLPRREAAGAGAGERPVVPTEEIKRRVRPRGGDSDGGDGDVKDRAAKAKRDAQRKEVPRDDPAEGEGQQPGGGRRGAGAISPAAPGAGSSVLVWWVLSGLLLAVLVAAVLLSLANRRKAAPAKPRDKTEPVEEQTEARPPLPHEQPASAWWREADDLARGGRHLDALRAVYLAVLSLLHRRQLIRFETTRTNGEYVEQVRRAAPPPRDLHEPFERLTALFEGKWYGDRSCDADEFRAGRALGQEIEGLASAAS
jgi:hypothetical protein